MSSNEKNTPAKRRKSLCHPVQPLYVDPRGVHRFKKNAIVDFLLENGPFDLNQIARKGFSNEDQEQFAQLIGYSLSGFGELSYVSNKTYKRAARQTPFIVEG